MWKGATAAEREGASGSLRVGDSESRRSVHMSKDGGGGGPVGSAASASVQRALHKCHYSVIKNCYGKKSFTPVGGG